MGISEIVQIVLGVIAAVSIAVAAFYAIRNKTTLDAALKAAESWESNAKAEREARERIEGRLAAAVEKIAKLEGQIEELSKRPDLRSLELALTRHEDQAEARAEKQILALAAITEKLSAPAEVHTHLHTDPKGQT